MRPPPWAEELVEQVYRDEGRDDLPELHWQNRNRSGSSGYARLGQNSITICAGQDPVDLKHVVLHECAHQLTKQKHTDEFWDKAFELFHRYRLPMERMVERSANYKKRAIAAYHRHSERLAAVMTDEVTERREGNRTADPSPLNLETLLESQNSDPSLNSGSVFPKGQLWLLSPRASKLLIFLLDKRSPMVITTSQDLIQDTDIKHTNLFHALKELKLHQLIGVEEIRDVQGHGNGICIKILHPPDKLPWRVENEKRQELLNERAKHQEEIRRIDRELQQLSKLSQSIRPLP